MSDKPPAYLDTIIEQLEAHTGKDLISGKFPPRVASVMLLFVTDSGECIRIDNTKNTDEHRLYMMSVLRDTHDRLATSLKEE